MSQSAKAAIVQDPSRSPTRRGWPRAAGEDALGQGAAAFQRAGFADLSLVMRWPEIAGAAVARIAQPVRWQEGRSGAVLTLKCHPGAIVFLQHETRSLIARVNAYAGAGRVDRVKLVPGVLFSAQDVPHHPDPKSGRDPQGGQDRLPALSEALQRLGKLRFRIHRSLRQRRPDQDAD